MPTIKHRYKFGKTKEIIEHICVQNGVDDYGKQVEIRRQTDPEEKEWKISFLSDGFWWFVATYCPFCGEKLKD